MRDNTSTLNGMIKVIEEKEVPRAEITCTNCCSRLEYGNADLKEKIDYTYGFNGLANYYFICPVCGVQVNAQWIVKD